MAFSTIWKRHYTVAEKMYWYFMSFQVNSNQVGTSCYVSTD